MRISEKGGGPRGWEWRPKGNIAGYGDCRGGAEEGNGGAGGIAVF